MGTVTTIHDHTDLVIKLLGKAKASALEEIGLAAEGYAKGLCPVRTGRLRNSITHAIDLGEECAVIGSNVEYARYVELGTSRMDPRPFLEPAAHDHASVYSEILRKHMSNA